jgi:hypothetical protein
MIENSQTLVLGGLYDEVRKLNKDDNRNTQDELDLGLLHIPLALATVQLGHTNQDEDYDRLNSQEGIIHRRHYTLIGVYDSFSAIQRF